MEKRVRGLQPGESIGSLFTFALMAMFAVLSLLIVIAGARVYRAVEETTTKNYNTRTAMVYLAGKVRASDEAGAITIREEDGTPVLVLSRTLSGKRYNTYIFCEDGAIREYFGSAERPFEKAFGEAITQAMSFVPELEGELLHITIADEAGNTHDVQLLLNAGEAGA